MSLSRLFHSGTVQGKKDFFVSNLDVELEPYEEVIGNLDFSTPVESRSTTTYRVSTTFFQEPIHQIGTISSYLSMA